MKRTPALAIAAACLSLTLLTACGSSGTSSSATASANSPSPSATLTGTELEAAIADKTYSGTADGKTYSEFYRADGTIIGTDYGGTWVIKGDQACFTYPPDAAQCYTLSVNGTAATWYLNGKAQDSGTFATGNAENLSGKS